MPTMRPPRLRTDLFEKLPRSQGGAAFAASMATSPSHRSGAGPTFIVSTPSYPSSSSSPIRPGKGVRHHLAIAAMDLLHSWPVRRDSALVSSDSCYRDLPPASGEHDVDVFGFGEAEDAGKLPSRLTDDCPIPRACLPSVRRAPIRNAASKSQPLLPPALATPSIQKGHRPDGKRRQMGRSREVEERAHQHSPPISIRGPSGSTS